MLCVVLENNPSKGLFYLDPGNQRVSVLSQDTVKRKFAYLPAVAPTLAASTTNIFTMGEDLPAKFVSTAFADGRTNVFDGTFAVPFAGPDGACNDRFHPGYLQPRLGPGQSDPAVAGTAVPALRTGPAGQVCVRAGVRGSSLATDCTTAFSTQRFVKELQLGKKPNAASSSPTDPTAWVPVGAVQVMKYNAATAQYDVWTTTGAPAPPRCLDVR